MGISWAYVNPNAKGTTNLKFSSLTSRILNRFGLNHFAHYDFFILYQNDLAYKSWNYLRQSYLLFAHAFRLYE